MNHPTAEVRMAFVVVGQYVGLWWSNKPVLDHLSKRDASTTNPQNISSRGISQLLDDKGRDMTIV